MANATVLRTGQINTAGDVNALFLKVFAGEVMTAFEEQNEMLDRHMIRSISSGKSAQFPATWKLTAAYHTPGTELVGQTSPLGERTITIDDLLVSDVFLASIDEAKAHYEVRSEYSMQAGAALRRTFNKNVLQVGVLAARAATTVTGGNGGTELTNANYLTDASVMAGGIFAASVALDEKDVPEDDRFVFVRPAQYSLLVQNKDTINKDWGGSGMYSDGTINRIGGIEIVKSRNLPNTNVTTGPAAYQGNFSTTAALVMNRRAVGTVKLMDLATEAEWDIRRQGWLLLAKYAMGHGILRPECAVELKTA